MGVASGAGKHRGTRVAECCTAPVRVISVIRHGEIGCRPDRMPARRPGARGMRIHGVSFRFMGVASRSVKHRGTLFAECCRSEEHTSELQSLMRISYAVFCLKKKKQTKNHEQDTVKLKITNKENINVEIL